MLGLVPTTHVFPHPAAFETWMSARASMTV